jgi:N-acetyl-alpha-D-glucosaminyl L-malate synthase BshA
MKIAIVLYPTYGGSGVVATELGMRLANKGHEIHFITYKQPVRLDLLNENIHFHEVHVPDYPLFQYLPYGLALASKMVDITKLFGIELFHVHYAIPHAYAAFNAKMMLKEEGVNIPIITTLHGTDITLVGSHPNYKPAVTFSINQSDYVTAVSQNLKESTLEIFDIKKDIQVIPNFIDTNHDRSDFTECNRNLLAKDHERIITHISNFRALKRVDDVVMIFNKILKKMPAKLILAGDGPEKEAIENLVVSLGIEESVIFLGNTNEVNKLLCFSDLFILPSEKESFGLAALEAMLYKTPVISSNAGGIPEVNKHNYSGFLSEIGAIDDMAKNALAILKNDDTLNLFKEQARKQAEKFDVTNVVPIYEALYQKALVENKNLI